MFSNILSLPSSYLRVIHISSDSVGLILIFVVSADSYKSLFLHAFCFMIFYYDSCFWHFICENFLSHGFKMHSTNPVAL